MAAMAMRPESAHNVNMAKPEQFTVKIEPDPLGAGRFRWTIREGEQIHLRSPHSYATRREAEQEADMALQKFAGSWQRNW
jgi:hypothetical protein